MTNTITIVTAVHGPSIPYLADAYASLAAQELPPDWTWQWTVQEDGETGDVAAALPDDSRISVGTGSKGGPGVARNLAMSRAEGSILRVLDADDQITPGALARDVTVLAENPAIGWTTASVLDLMPDGTTVGWEHADPPEGRLQAGAVLSYFTENKYRLPVHPATLCIRTELAMALGGWMALPGGEDTGLLIAASVVSDGYFIAKPGLLYRKHPAQLTSQPGWSGTAEWMTRMRVIEARGEALQRLGAHYQG
ncbi:glycosyltransferase [Luedemannella helvata]|uniref:Glycosyltransferase family 2 protein n=1 Tax=Luedemannella helvata TaxID=349315 RepID=A0ABP4X2A6_9ACTN